MKQFVAKNNGMITKKQLIAKGFKGGLFQGRIGSGFEGFKGFKDSSGLCM